jgi:hypothetical protein
MFSAILVKLMLENHRSSGEGAADRDGAADLDGDTLGLSAVGSREGTPEKEGTIEIEGDGEVGRGVG